MSKQVFYEAKRKNFRDKIFGDGKRCVWVFSFKISNRNLDLVKHVWIRLFQKKKWCKQYHHGLLSISVCYFKIFVRSATIWIVVSLPNFNFFNVNPQFFQRNRKVHLSNFLETNFHDIPNISLRDIRRGNYS